MDRPAGMEPDVGVLPQVQHQGHRRRAECKKFYANLGDSRQRQTHQVGRDQQGH